MYATDRQTSDKSIAWHNNHSTTEGDGYNGRFNVFPHSVLPLPQDLALTRVINTVSNFINSNYLGRWTMA